MSSVDVHGDTILLETIKSYHSYHHSRIIKLLLAEEGLDPDAKDKAGRTPLWWAYSTKNENLVKLLLETGKVNIHPQDDKGERPPGIEKSCGSCTGYLPAWGTSYHCGICTSGGSDFVLCQQCVDRGERCLGVEHSLEGLRQPGTKIICESCWQHIPPSDQSHRCGICLDGDFDLCQQCVDRGEHCLDIEHRLAKFTILP
jgi:hypothetical protein